MSGVFGNLIDAVRAEVSGMRALESVRALARFHRVQASPGYDEAADWLAGRIEEAGLQLEIEKVRADGRNRVLGQLMPRGWECRRAFAVLHDGAESLRLCDDAEQKLSLILRSAPARGRFALAALSDGTEPSHYAGVDVRGRVVLTDATDVHRVPQLAVVERGAAGLLACGRRLVPPVRDAFSDPDSVAYTSFWWGEEEPRGWGFVVSPRRGAWLRERLGDGRALEIEVEIDSRAFDTDIPLISAVRPGARGPSGPMEREVLVVSHLCHPEPSANDNASGAAANLEAARALSALSARIAPARRPVRHLWIPEFTGTFAWLGSRGEGGGILAALNLDMVGEDQAQCGSTFLIEHSPCFAASFAETLLGALRERLADATAAYSGVGRIPLQRMGEVPYAGGSDHAVLVDPAVGIPCPMLIQWPDRYYHSSLDTPDRCDPRSLALSAGCAAAYAGWLAAAGAEEAAPLAAAVARRARVRLLEALESGDRGRLAEAELLRGTSALESIRRLAPRGGGPALLERVIEPEVADLREFFGREIAGRLGPAAAGAPSGGPVPRRLLPAPLHYQRRLIAGFGSLPAGEREDWRRAEQPPDDLAPLFELAWMACDGRRDLAAIEHLVWLESGRRAPDPIRRFFEWTARLGLSEWERAPEERWSSSAPATATP